MLKWKRERVLVPKIPHQLQGLEIRRLTGVGAARQQGRDPDSLTIPLPSHSSYPLHQDGLKTPTGVSFKNGSKSRGSGGNWSMQTPCSLPGLPEKINDGRILAAAHTGVLEWKSHFYLHPSGKGLCRSWILMVP